MRDIFKWAQGRQRLLVTLTAITVPAVIIVSAVVRLWLSESISTYIEGEIVESITADWSLSGHADYTSRAFIFWDDDDPPLIPADCAGCHSLPGILDFVGERGTPVGSVSRDMPTGTVVSCNACHNNAVHELQTVVFPSGERVEAWDAEAACLVCHQGLESTVSVNDAIAGLDDDRVDDNLEFINVHYHVAGATLMGTVARGGFEYADHSYVGRFEHVENYQTCHACHDAHSLRVDPLMCSTCHVEVNTVDDLRRIRQDDTDYDGDGDTSKGIAAEIDRFHEQLYEAIQVYATDVIGVPIAYSVDQAPHFFVDNSGDGVVTDDLSFGNGYSQWTPRLLRAAYNYHFVRQDTGAYAHNPRYALQILYDSLQDLADRITVSTEGLRRP